MRLHFRIAFTGLTAILVLARCTTPPQAETNQVVIWGRVVNAAQAPVPGATVQVGAQGKPVTSDGTGAFQIPYDGKVNDIVALIAQSPTYARCIRPYALSPGPPTPVTLELHPLDQATTVHIPAAGEPAATVVASNPNGTATLTVDADSLVDPSGATVTGTVAVRLTYWSPQDSPDNAPGVLYALPDGQTTMNRGGLGDLIKLQTFGMADIELSQNGSLLQVAPGKTLTLQMTTPPAMRPLLASGKGMPDLYSLDPNVGFWRHEGSIADGKVEYDVSSGVFTARLPHLSSWNLDSGIPASNGGCVQGRVVDICDPNRVLAQADVTVWMLDWEQTVTFHGRTGNNGSYCIPVPEPTFAAGQTTTSHYLITGDNPKATSQCNPMPAACQVCSGDRTDGYCNDCRFESNYVSDEPDAIYYSDSCQPSTPTVNINACTFCPGTAPAACSDPVAGPAISTSGCSVVETVAIAGPNCHCDNQGKCPVCTSSLGQPCRTDADCCSNGDGTSNICSDQLCVPPVDPQ